MAPHTPLEELYPYLHSLYEQARGAHHAISWDPGKAAHYFLGGYEYSLKQDIEKLQKIGKAADIPYYISTYKSHLSNILSAKSRTMSSWVTGASKFPTKRNQKALSAEENRYNEFGIWRSKMFVVKRLDGNITPTTEYEKAVKDLEKAINEHSMSKEINKIMSRYKGKPPFEVLKNVGLSDKTTQALLDNAIAPNGRVYLLSLTNITQNIARLKSRVDELKQKLENKDKEEKYVFEGGEIDVDYKDDRVRIYYEEKPTDAQRNTLKSSGFNWSPTNGAWQRKATRAGIWDAIRITKATPVETQTEQDTEDFEIMPLPKFNLPISLPQQPRKYMAYLILLTN